jgi:hypothetical protein
MDSKCYKPNVPAYKQDSYDGERMPWPKEYFGPQIHSTVPTELALYPATESHLRDFKHEPRD